MQHSEVVYRLQRKLCGGFLNLNAFASLSSFPGMETVGTFMKWHAMQGRSGQKQKTKECKSADIVAQLTWRAKFSVEKSRLRFNILGHLKLLDSTWCQVCCGPKLVSSLTWSLLGCWATWWLPAWELQVGCKQSHVSYTETTRNTYHLH